MSAQKHAAGLIPLMTDFTSHKHMHASLPPSLPIITRHSDSCLFLIQPQTEHRDQQISASCCAQDFHCHGQQSQLSIMDVITHKKIIWIKNCPVHAPTHTHTHTDCACNNKYSQCVITAGCSSDSCCFPLNGALSPW